MHHGSDWRLAAHTIDQWARPIPARRCSAPVPSSKPGRPSGSRRMRCPVFSTAICRSIHSAASRTCSRLRVARSEALRPRPGRWHAHRVGPISYLRRIRRCSILAQLVFHPARVFHLASGATGAIRRCRGGAVRKTPPRPATRLATLRIIERSCWNARSKEEAGRRNRGAGLWNCASNFPARSRKPAPTAI